MSYFSFLFAKKAMDSEAKATTDTELMGMRMAAKMGVRRPRTANQRPKML